MTGTTPIIYQKQAGQPNALQSSQTQGYPARDNRALVTAPVTPGVNTVGLQIPQANKLPQTTTQDGPLNFSKLVPSPAEFALGTAAGLILSPLVNHANKDNGTVERFARFVDTKTPGIHHLGQAFDRLLKKPGNQLKKYDWLKNLMMTEALASKGASKDQQARKATQAVKAMENYQLRITLGQLKGYFTDRSTRGQRLKKLYEKLFHTGNNPSDIHLLKPETYRNKDFSAILDNLDQKIKQLSRKKVKTKDEKFILTRLTSAQARIGVLNNQYKPAFSELARMTARLSAQGVGPIGRMIKSFGYTLKQNFSGATLKPTISNDKTSQIAEKAFHPKNIWQKLTHLRGKTMLFVGPAFFGFGIVLASAIHQYNQAKPKEKTAAFSHDLLGIGIANLAGWEIGRRFLNTVGFSRIFGRKASRIIVPKLNWTVAGIATELTAMLLIASKFQAGGEKLSHSIFGKPSPESLGETNTETTSRKPEAKILPQQPKALTGRPLPSTPAIALPTRPLNPFVSTGPQSTSRSIQNNYPKYQTLRPGIINRQDLSGSYATT